MLKQLGADHPDVADSFNNIGMQYYKRREYDMALEFLQKALVIRLKRLGPDHPNVAHSYNNIGTAHGKKGEYDRALEYCQKSLAIELKQLGADHPSMATDYFRIGGLYFEKGDYKEAGKWCRKAAEQNYPPAQDVLGVLYAAGRGVDPDFVEAYKWFCLAAANGYTKAKSRKDTLAKKMTPEQITKAEAQIKEMIEKNPKLIRK